VNFITDVDVQFASVVVELLQRDEAFRLQTSVNGNPTSLVIDINDDSGEDSGFLGFLQRVLQSFRSF
jgi:hypothetical protein